MQAPSPETASRFTVASTIRDTPTMDGTTRPVGLDFLNPNYDRYSNLSGSVAKQFRLSNANSMVLGASLNWAIDQDTRLGDIEQTGEGSDITLQARFNLGQVSLGISQVLGDILPQLPGQSYGARHFSTSGRKCGPGRILGSLR